MATERLIPRFVKKPWGVESLPKWLLPVASEERIGEVWFDKRWPDGRTAALLVKFILTSEKLSVQVHPDDAQAAAAGLGRGKSECWFGLDASPEANVALGLKAPATLEQVEAAARDGSIVGLLDWRPVEKSGIFNVPAGTIHAIGAGCVLVEVQQNSDTTYRLFDYGRPRELHLRDGLAVSRLEPAPPNPAPRRLDERRQVLVESPLFVLERWTVPAHTELLLGAGDEVWLILLAGELEIQGARFRRGEVAFHAADAASTVTGGEAADLLVAYPGGTIAKNLMSDVKATTRGFWDAAGTDGGSAPSA